MVERVLNRVSWTTVYVPRDACRSHNMTVGSDNVLSFYNSFVFFLISNNPIRISLRDSVIIIINNNDFNSILIILK